LKEVVETDSFHVKSLLCQLDEVRDELRALKAKERRRAAKRKKRRERPEDEAA